MRAATRPDRPRREARLGIVTSDGSIRHGDRAELVEALRPGDLLVANDAATLPASLRGVHGASNEEVEVRLAGRGSLDRGDVRAFTAVLFGEGDHRVPTERRPPPPSVRPGDRIRLGSLRARVVEHLDHPRLVRLGMEGPIEDVWKGIASHGRPIQYAHVAPRLRLWDVWTRFAGPPVAFEPPSAGFVLDWSLLGALGARGVGFATLTHAAGISSTGDPELDARLPLDEAYRIPPATARRIEETKRRGGRVIAVGTTVTRALEHAARVAGEVREGEGLATQRIGPGTHLRVVDALLTGVHEAGDSHHELLRAFLPPHVLGRLDGRLEAAGYRTHEFGDFALVPRLPRSV